MEKNDVNSAPVSMFRLSRVAERYEPILYAGLRIVFAVILLTHGLPKLLGTPHGSVANPMASTTALIQKATGLSFAPQLAFLIMLLETGGAVLFALGFETRIIAFLLCLEMIGISVALGPVWPWIERGVEYPVLMFFLALYFLARGGGAYAMDARLRDGMR